MLEAAEAVMRKLDGVDLDAYMADEDKRDAVAYRLQIIGEAAYHVSDALKEQHPVVDWFKIQGLRHRIVHDYRRIDDSQIFRIANKYLPPLVEQLRRMLDRGAE
ncbi:MAG TPA: DUF86 domain-containing protein [Flavobacteriales bacterium]|nr:DUF86 domain-containing protein [Flavobacteriales bacterium]